MRQTPSTALAHPFFIDHQTPDRMVPLNWLIARYKEMIILKFLKQKRKHEKVSKMMQIQCTTSY